MIRSVSEFQLTWQDRRAAISEAESSLTEQARKLHEDIKQTRATLVRVRAAHRTVSLSGFVYTLGSPMTIDW